MKRMSLECSVSLPSGKGCEGGSLSLKLNLGFHAESLIDVCPLLLENKKDGCRAHFEEAKGTMNAE